MSDRETALTFLLGLDRDILKEVLTISALIADPLRQELMKKAVE